MSYNGAVLTKDTNSNEQCASQQLTSQPRPGLFISILTSRAGEPTDPYITTGASFGD